MGFKRNKKYEQIAIYTLITLAILLLIYFFFHSFDVVRSAVNYVFDVLSPLIYGFLFAYLANPLMVFFENKVFRFSPKRRLYQMRRGFSVAAAILVIALVIILMLVLLIPQITTSYNELQSQVGGYLSSAQKWADDLVSNFPLFNGRINSLNDLLDVTEVKMKLREAIANSYSFLSDAANYVIAYAGAIVIELKNIFFGVILAVYFLLSKEKICAQSKKVLSAILPRKFFLNVFNLAKHADRSFGQFIRGKLVDALIIGLITFFTLWIFGFPFYPLIAVLVGVTNIIPIVGPFLGAIPSGFLILIVEPGKLLWFVIIIIIIQQLDGNLIGPKIIGNVTGLSAMWIIIAITLGGELFGIPGMLFAVPVTSVIYALVRELTESRLKRREMPHTTAYYYDHPTTDELPKDTILLYGEAPPAPPEDEAESAAPSAEEAPKKKLNIPRAISRRRKK